MNTIINTLATLVNSMVNVTYKTDVKMNKRGNSLLADGKSVTKVCVANLLYTDKSYAELNGLTEVNSLPYGAWVEGKENMLIENNGKTQIRFYATADTKTATTYFVDGKEATEEEVALIKSFLPKRSETERKAFEPRNISEEKIVEVAVA